MSSIVNKLLHKDEETKPTAKKTSDTKKNVPAKKKVTTSVKAAASSKKTDSEKKTTAKVKTRVDVNAYKILKRPLITEKVTELTQLNKYVFEVPVKTSKSEVAKAIQNVYGVKPIKVNVINVSGKKVRRGRRFGKTRDWRKAVITLAAGDSIEVYEGV